MGAAGSASSTISFDLFDVNDEFVIDTSGATYIGGGTPIGLPLQVTGQRNMQTGDMMVTVGGGDSDVLEVGFSYEAASSEFETDFSVTRYDRSFEGDGVIIVSEISGNESGYTVVISYATDLEGNRLTPIEGKPFLEAASYPLDPGYNSYYVFKTDDATSTLITDRCFLPGTLITMADGSKKPIEDILPGNMALFFDEQGELVPGKVTRTKIIDATMILDFHGSKVTPGHVYWCTDGAFAGQFGTLIDILRSDGADLCIADLIRAGGGTVNEAGLIVTEDTPEGIPLHWPFSQILPKPEDDILACSRLTLPEIFTAAEWEDQRPAMY